VTQNIENKVVWGVTGYFWSLKITAYKQSIWSSY